MALSAKAPRSHLNIFNRLIDFAIEGNENAILKDWRLNEIPSAKLMKVYSCYFFFSVQKLMNLYEITQKDSERIRIIKQ